ncbi:MAG: 1-acyl-sn-glycerol-3-phosphate acyltransferase [Bacteroidota bacterium]|jgi:putative hemolysin
MRSDKFIDVKNLIKTKSPRLAKWIPRFIIRYLTRILHEDEINDFLELHKDEFNADFCRKVVDYFNIKIEVQGIENAPTEGPVIFTMNHPLGGMDAMVFISAIREKRTDLKFIVNDLLMHLPNLRELFVGVNKHGKNDPSVREQINQLFSSENAVCIFPAGLVSRRTKGEIMDLEWKKTFVTYARRNGQPIVPVYIEGELSPFFYRLAWIRKFLRIRINLEMLFLSDEMFKQRDKTIRFVIGKPIYIKDFEERDDKILAQKIRTMVYEQKNRIELE